MTCLSANRFAEVAGLAERTARQAFKRCAEDKSWRGHFLPVVPVTGQQGGAGGMASVLDLTQASPMLLTEFPALVTYRDDPATPAAPQAHSRAIRPIIWQEREGYEFQSLVDTNDPHVFMRGEYVYGIRARVNAGFGIWQLAFGSKATLTTTNYAAARAAMMNVRADGGRVLGVSPTMLIVPPTLEAQAREILTNDMVDGSSNPWKGTASLIVSPFLES